MIYRFDVFALDTDKRELRREGEPVPVEPQVLALLRLLVENRHRLVDRDEIVEKVWGGRIVSEAAISSRIKSARQALGDSGAEQRMIRTLPKLGIRFVADVETDAPEPRPQTPETAAAPSSRPSIAILPFKAMGGAEPWVAEALPSDIIAELSRLRWLFVIARGSSFRFREGDHDAADVGRALGVRYCLSGTIAAAAGMLTASVELSDTADAGVVWSERFEARLEAVHEIRGRIVQAVTSALDLHIPLNEARRADLRLSEDLDAWSAYHLGLRHLYRFSRADTAQAVGLFERAIALDPAFARAYAALSFAHFENAFLHFASDGEAAADKARRAAERGLEQDALDPFCNLVMGRAHWLSGDLEASLPWLDRAIQLNPNFAQGTYSRAWTRTLLGEGLEGRSDVDLALRLSPLDPLAYGMRGVRAFTHMVQDEPAEAAEWGEHAARSPGAHALIEMVAAVGHSLAGDEARAVAWARSARQRRPGLTTGDFLGAFPFRDSAARERIARALQRLNGE